MQREAFKVKSGTEYDQYFPKAKLVNILEKKDATVADTIKLIPRIVNETLGHTRKIAEFLKGRSLKETCRNIWFFVFEHIAYKKDEQGKEQVRSPARTWNDRHNFLQDMNGEKVPGGVDCDCMTTFISSILSNLKIRHALRIVKFGEPHYQHIYPIVPLPGGDHITMDCVVRNFNYEEPYTEKNDTQMDLEYLNGVNDSITNRNVDSADMAGLNDDYNTMSDLGRMFRRRNKGGGDSGGGGDGGGGSEKKRKRKAKLKEMFKKRGIRGNTKKGGKFKKFARKFMNITNKVNPGTIPIRAGILAAMRTNFFKIAQRLKYAYLSDEEMQRRGGDMAKFEKLKRVKERFENIFEDLGGKKENFKKAILTGRGNRDKDVMAGLGYMPENLYGMSNEDSVSNLLGSDMFYGESINSVQGLGEVATAAVIAAATGILGAIAVLIKQIGSMFPKKSKENKDFQNVDAKQGANSGSDSDATPSTDTPSTDTPSNETPASDNSGGSTDAGSGDNIRTSAPDTNSDGNSSSNSESGSGDTNSDSGNMSSVPAKTDADDSEKNSGDGDDKEEAGSGANARGKGNENEGNNTKPAKESFWKKNKNWLLPTSVSAGVITLSMILYKIFHKDEDTFSKGKTHGHQLSLSGIPSKKKRRRKHRPKIKSKKKKTVAFV